MSDRISSAILYVDRATIAPGRAAELRARIGELANLIAAQEPQLVAYEAFFDPSGSAMSVVHLHVDSASLERHMDVVEPELAAFRDLVTLQSIDVYGQPSRALVERLRRKAQLLGRDLVIIHDPVAGFARLDVAAVVRPDR